MLRDGTLGEREQRALDTDRRVAMQYRRLRSCDGALEAMMSIERPAGEGEEAEAPGAARAANKTPKLLYAEYLYCASAALCEKPLVEWGVCVKAVGEQKKDMKECAQAKRLLERCLRGKTEHLLRGSQPQVFRPNATP
ncbi:hypothetical protein BBJ28_00011876 [Nothophytophthora sp. Chile5]|nr:hypothetical protein BBJ28_00011876 [Nothophytophthora sp. Chile5]